MGIRWSRREDWDLRLWAEIESSRGRPFNRANNDCVRFSLRCFEAMTGQVVKHPALEYRSGHGALRMLFSGGGMEKIATSVFGPSEDPELAGRGDLVLVDTKGEDGLLESLGVCVGQKIAVMLTTGGLAFLPRSRALRTWRI